MKFAAAVLLIGILNPSVVFSQEIDDLYVDFALVNAMDSTKVVYLKEKGSLEINYESASFDSLIESKYTYLYAEIDRVTDTSLLLTPYNSTDIIRYYSGNEQEIYTTYYDNEPLELAINQIENLQYSSPTRNFFNGFGGTLVSLSSFSALIVAPLVSVNFKNGAFNKQRYYSVAGYSLMGLTVGIPFMIFTKPKKYIIQENGTDPENGYWYVKPSPYD